MLCAHKDCSFRITETPLGWMHVDTHGVDTDHKAELPESVDK